MSVIGPSCQLPSEDSPGCGCAPPNKAGGKIAATASITALAAVACTACCVLPFTLPAALLALAGGSIAVLDHAHGWMTRIAVIAVITAWIWIALQVQKTGRPMAPNRRADDRRNAAHRHRRRWPLLEPVVFKTLGIVKKKAPPQSG